MKFSPISLQIVYCQMKFLLWGTKPLMGINTQ